MTNTFITLNRIDLYKDGMSHKDMLSLKNQFSTSESAHVLSIRVTSVKELQKLGRILGEMEVE